MTASNILSNIIKLDNEIMDLQTQFDNSSQSEKAVALKDLEDKYLTSTKESDELPMELIRAAGMICYLDNAAAMLAVGLSHINEDVRNLFADALVSVGEEEGIEAVIPAVDYALEKGDISALEMPFILTMIDDPLSSSQIHRFLPVDNIDVVYAAIEACASIEDPSSLKLLKEMTDDKRLIDKEEDDDDDVSIGMLAQEAINIIESEQE